MALVYSTHKKLIMSNSSNEISETKYEIWVKWKQVCEGFQDCPFTQQCQAPPCDCQMTALNAAPTPGNKHSAPPVLAFVCDFWITKVSILP